MPPTDALTVRTLVTEQLETTGFRQAVEDFLRDVIAKEGKLRRYSESEMLRRHGPAALASAVAMAETYYVAPEMQLVAQAAAETFPDDEVILKEDQPSEAGFMVLPARLRMLDLRGRIMVVHAVVWINNRGWLLGDRLDPDDQINLLIHEDTDHDPDLFRHLINVAGRYDIIAPFEFDYGKPLPQVFQVRGGVLSPDAIVRWDRDENGNVIMYTDHGVDLADLGVHRDPVLVFVLAVWRLMQQTLAHVERTEDHPRPDRRRAERKHVPLGVTVIQLRRVEQAYEHGTGNAINIRYLRRGHWRRVWCGPMDGERYQRAVWIHPTICGPKDAPLIIRKKINALVR